MVSQVYAYVQTHHIIHISYVQGFVYQLYLNKTFFKNLLFSIIAMLIGISEILRIFASFVKGL